MPEFAFDAALIIGACVLLILLLLGSIFGFTYQSERRRRRRQRLRRASHNKIDILRKEPDPAAESGPEAG